MQEVPLVAPHLDAPGVEKVEQRSQCPVPLQIEGDAVAVGAKRLLDPAERSAQLPARELGLGRVARPAPRK